jgi:hypothetical protein
VTFEDGSTVLGTGTLTNGVATYTTSSLAVGSHTITAVYSGDSNYSGSTSTPLIQIVNPNGFGDAVPKSTNNPPASSQLGTSETNATTSLPRNGSTIGIGTTGNGPTAPTSAATNGSRPKVASGSTKTNDVIDQALGSLQNDSSAGIFVNDLALEQASFQSGQPPRTTDGTNVVEIGALATIDGNVVVSSLPAQALDKTSKGSRQSSN